METGSVSFTRIREEHDKNRRPQERNHTKSLFRREETHTDGLKAFHNLRRVRQSIGLEYDQSDLLQEQTDFYTISKTQNGIAGPLNLPCMENGPLFAPLAW